MKKWLILLFSVLTTLLQGCSEVKGPLIQEILTTTHPKKFEIKNNQMIFSVEDVSDIVLKYIPLGTPRLEVKKILIEQEFNVSEETQKLKECNACDALTIQANYANESKIPFLPDRSYIGIVIAFKDNKLFFIGASHALNDY